MDFKLLRDLGEIFRYRGDAQVIVSLAARPPLRYSALARAIIEVTGDRLADGEINRCLPRLEAAGLVIAEGPQRRKAYRLTSLGREKAATLTLIADTLSRREGGPSNGEAMRVGGELQAGTGPDRTAGEQATPMTVATTASSVGPQQQTTVDNGRRRPPTRNTDTEDVVQVPPVDKQDIDTSVAHSARRYNYWLGGKDNFAADRESADAIEAQFPGVRLAAQANRAFLKRAVEFLVTDAGIRQFLDIGTGLPVADNTHEVAQAIAPESRIVYVDNDPLVLVHARALLNSTPQGTTSYLQADLRDPDAILRDAAVTGTLDMSKPVALMLIAVLHFITGRGAAKPLVDRLMSALPSGSYLVVTHSTADFATKEQAAVVQQMMDAGKLDSWPRRRDEIADLFDGFRIVEPGLVPVSEWRPDPNQPLPNRQDIPGWAAIARKP